MIVQETPNPAGSSDEPKGPRAVFISDFLHLGTPFAELADKFADPMAAWLSRVQASVDGQTRRPGGSVISLSSGVASVEMEAGLAWKNLAVPVTLRVGPPRVGHGYVLTPISWTPHQLGSLLPELIGHLELSPLDQGGESSRLGLYARYVVPLAAAGLAVDRLALHRVAEATMRRFLRELGDALTSS